MRECEGRRAGDGKEGRHAIRGMFRCPHAAVNPFHTCTARCEELVEKRRRMYMRATPMREESGESGESGDGAGEGEKEWDGEGVVVLPSAEPIRVVRWSEREARETPAWLMALDEPVVVSGAIRDWQVDGRGAAWSAAAVREDMCAGDARPVVVVYDRFPDPATAVRTSLETYVEYAESYKRRSNGDGGHEGEGKEGGEGKQIDDGDEVGGGCMDRDDDDAATALTSHERHRGAPLLLADWRETSAKMRRRTDGFTPAFLRRRADTSAEHGCPPPASACAGSLARSEAVDVLPRGGILGLQKVGAAVRDTTVAAAVTWHAVLGGTRQVVVYAPKETKAIGGDEIVEGTSRFSPFESAPTRATRGGAREETSVVIDAAVGNATTVGDDLARAARRARARIAVLGPGDALVVPRSWWWTTLALETGVAVTGNVGRESTSHAFRSSTTTTSAAAHVSATTARDGVSLLNDKSADITQRCLAAKRIGNDYFTKKRFQNAVEAYSVGIRLLSAEDVDAARGTMPVTTMRSSSTTSAAASSEESRALLAILRCNRAAVSLKLKRWHDAIEDCTAALRISHTQHHHTAAGHGESDGSDRARMSSPTATTAKLYYRRARALEMIGDADGAVRDMKRVLELEPNNASALHCMREYSSILNRLIIVNRGAEDVRRRQVKGLYTGVPANYAEPI